MFCREFYSQRVYAFFVLFFLGKKCARANFYTFRMSDESGKRKNNEAERKQAKKITNILDHISGNDENTQAALISKVIHSKGQNFADKVTLNSPELQECKKLSPEETAAFLSGANLSTNVLTKGITMFNKKWGRNPFASQKKVKAVREQILPINRFLK